MAAFTTMLDKRMTFTLWLVIALVASIVMCPASCVSQDGELFDNNNVNNIKNNKQFQSEVDKRPFFVGSRYGRSDAAYDSNSGLRGGLQVAPRNDRFFLGSRYGKRSREEAGFPVVQNAVTTDGAALTCLYSGIGNIYRCYGRETFKNEDHYSTNELATN